MQAEWSEVASLRQRIEWMQAEIAGLKTEGKWWEAKWRDELAARYRAVSFAADRGVHIPTDL